MNCAGARVAAVLAALVVAACSSSSSTSSTNAGGSSGDGGDVAQDGGSGGAAGYDAAATDYDAAVAACAAYSSTVELVGCCEQQIPGGYLTLQVAEQECLCGSSGPCSSACDYQDCISLQGSTPACQSCLDTNLAGSCKSTVAAACARDPGCIAYEACITG